MESFYLLLKKKKQKKRSCQSYYIALLCDQIELTLFRKFAHPTRYLLDLQKKTIFDLNLILVQCYYKFLVFILLSHFAT